MHGTDLSTLRTRFRNAYREYYGVAARIDQEIENGAMPSEEVLTKEEAAAEELAVARREWLRALLDSMEGGTG